MSRMMNSPFCMDSRRCFAANYKSGVRYCRILTEGYSEDGTCPFCKPDAADIINEKYHKLIQDNGLLYNRVAMAMGISPHGLSNILANPMSEKSIIRLKQAVKELKREREKNV